MWLGFCDTPKAGEELLCALTSMQAATNENISPKVMIRMMGEMKELQKSPIDGVRVIMNEECVTDIQADISGPGAPCASPPRPPSLCLPCL